MTSKIADRFLDKLLRGGKAKAGEYCQPSTYRQTEVRNGGITFCERTCTRYSNCSVSCTSWYCWY